MNETLKEMFFAKCENDGTITGCRKYSFIYYHEYKHSLQFKEWKRFIWLWNQTLSYTPILGGIMLIFIFHYMSLKYLYLGGLFILPVTFLTLIMEFDATVYAIKTYFLAKEVKDETN